jgi:hypothetical protein
VAVAFALQVCTSTAYTPALIRRATLRKNGGGFRQRALRRCPTQRHGAVVMQVRVVRAQRSGRHAPASDRALLVGSRLVHSVTIPPMWALLLLLILYGTVSSDARTTSAILTMTAAGRAALGQLKFFKIHILALCVPATACVVDMY